MSFPSHLLLAASALLIFGVLQTLGAPTSYEDDKDYQYFKQKIDYEKQQAESQLNISRELFINNTKTYNLPEFDEIHFNLTRCFEDLYAAQADADPMCMEFVNETVQQTIYNSQKEVEFCTNLTHSWELIDEILKTAEVSITKLNSIVTQILQRAALCVPKYQYNPSLKISCFNQAEAVNQKAFDQAKADVQLAYFEISGGGLLMGAEVSSCQEAENFSFEEKCQAITKSVLSDCVPPTTTTTTTTTRTTTTAAPVQP